MLQVTIETLTAYNTLASAVSNRNFLDAQLEDVRWELYQSIDVSLTEPAKEDKAGNFSVMLGDQTRVFKFQITAELSWVSITRKS